MKSYPKVSIIIPVYNGSNYLNVAIDSALAQTYKNIEIIVVNDGSTDNGATDKIAMSYGDKIRYFSKKNGGVATALNYGIQKMTGDYFSWLSHDDYFIASKTKEQVDFLLDIGEGKTPLIIASNAISLFGNSIKKCESINSGVFNDYFDIFLAASARVGLNGCSLLIPKEPLRQMGGFNVDLQVTQDYDLWYRLKDKCKFVLLDRHLVVYRHHAMQDSTQKAHACLVVGDDFRAGILQSMDSAYFNKFLLAEPANEKWIWDNLATYNRRGHIKTVLAILRLLFSFYNEHDPGRYRAMLYRKDISDLIKRGTVNTEPSANKAYKKSDIPLNVVLSMVNSRYVKITDETYISFRAKNGGGRLSQYLHSIKDDGILFFVQRVWRKLTRMIIVRN
jgi:glycosyltransferase involved in cell wall biosynthesis